MAGSHASRWSDRDHGFATVWAAGASAALIMVGVLVMWLGTAVVTRHRATGAADLGALAAAGYAASGERYACGRARWVVERMRTRLVSCRLDGWDARVKVTSEPPSALAGFGSANARARAGPAAADQPSSTSNGRQHTTSGIPRTPGR
ncbi:MAG: hypothetical protein GEU98_11550 [Pseudonocardiaceae bacterium]|nr:hypothetical protein [Pseudonocardiaceae bacterium]